MNRSPPRSPRKSTDSEGILDDLELKALLNGPNDAAGAILTINARDGGTDANDWADMMLRMYSAWAVANDLQNRIAGSPGKRRGGDQPRVDRHPRPDGLRLPQRRRRYASIGPNQSVQQRRKTTNQFCRRQRRAGDRRFDRYRYRRKGCPRSIRYRASGAGGQHVNKTDSAIRLTHIPTNTVVQCQNERSQHQNRATAWKMLRAKMARIEEERREAEDARKYETQARTGFGSQIRNYFLHPDQRVKDARTGHYVGNFNSVMDGSELQGFFDAFLRLKAGKAEKT